MESKAFLKSMKTATRAKFLKSHPSRILLSTCICSAQLRPGWKPALFTCSFASSFSQILFSKSLLYSFAALLISEIPLQFADLTEVTLFWWRNDQILCPVTGRFLPVLDDIYQLGSLTPNSSPAHLIASAVML